MHVRAPSLKADTSSVLTVSVAAVSGHATIVQDSLIELLTTYFSPTFALLTRVADGSGTNLGSASLSKLHPA